MDDNDRFLSDIPVRFSINADMWQKLKRVQKSAGLSFFSEAIKMVIHKGLEVLNSGR